MFCRSSSSRISQRFSQCLSKSSSKSSSCIIAILLILFFVSLSHIFVAAVGAEIVIEYPTVSQFQDKQDEEYQIQNDSGAYPKFYTIAEVNRLLETANKSVNVFYSTHCSACLKVIPMIKDSAKEYPNVTVNYYNILDSGANYTLMTKFASKYGVRYPNYPVVFSGETVILQGYQSISKNFEDLISALDAGIVPDPIYELRWHTGKGADDIDYDTINGSYTPLSPQSYSKTVSPLTVVIAALIDGVNPCAFSVLIFLLISLMSAHSRSKILLTGFVYILAVFTLYILAGLGIMSVVAFSGLAVYFSALAGILAILAGIISVTEGVMGRFNKKSPISLSIPKSRSGLIKSIIELSTIPAAFVLGIVVGIVELPCTGGIYLAVLSMLSSSMTFEEGVLLLILYNFIFVLPLIIIVLLVTFGLPPEKFNELRLKYRRSLKVIVGIVLLLIGLFVLIWNFVI